MGKGKYLGAFEQIADRNVTFGTVYGTLERLEAKGTCSGLRLATDGDASS